MPKWLQGSRESLDPGMLEGTVFLRCTLEDQRLTSLQAAVAEALIAILNPVAGLSLLWSGLSSDGETTQSSSKQAPCNVAVSRGTRPSNANVEFNFKVMLADPNDLSAALELLRLEARLGGAKQLLPQIMQSLGEVAGCLSLRLDVTSPQEDPIMVAMVPATQSPL